MRFFCGIILFGLACSSCDLNPSYGCHDFSWGIGGAQKTTKVFWGWIQDKNEKPLFAVCAISDTRTSANTQTFGNWVLDTDNNGRIVGFQGARFQISRFKKAIYALQADHSLREIPLSEQETETLLTLFDSQNNDEAKSISEEPLVREKIVPQLQEVQLTP
jgi:hypothetical protein